MSAMTMLGIFIYNLIAGDGQDSLINVLERFFRSEIASKAGVF